MEHTFPELKKKNVDDLRKIAEEAGVQGFTQMNKEHLIPEICKALGIEAREQHVAHGIGKAKVKAQIKELKAQRDSALEAKDHAALKKARRQIHKLKHKLRAAAR
jgi:hypothetical protein